MNNNVKRMSGEREQIKVVIGDQNKMFWIAINGASCAIQAVAGIPLESSKPVVSPIPELLVGFPTASEALKAQRLMLNGSIPACRMAIKSWMRDSNVVSIVYEHPEPPGPVTHWNIH